MNRLRRAARAAAALTALALGGCGWARLPQGATVQAGAMHRDWSVFTLAGLCVFALVATLILFPMVVWRRRDDELPPQFRFNLRIELLTTAIPLVMVALLFALSYQVESAVERLAPAPAAAVNVVGFRWSWRFSYPGHGVVLTGTPQRPPEMVIPLGETTRIDLASADVNHAFWVPGFLFKRDAIAGVHNVFDWMPNRAGVYVGRCAEFCGLQHAFMTFTVRVVPPAEFARWLARARRSSALAERFR